MNGTENEKRKTRGKVHILASQIIFAELNGNFSQTANSIY